MTLRAKFEDRLCILLMQKYNRDSSNHLSSKFAVTSIKTDHIIWLSVIGKNYSKNVHGFSHRTRGKNADSCLNCPLI